MKKKKSNDPKVYAVTTIDEQVFIPVGGPIIEKNWDFWESLRRHPQYLKLCEDISFLGVGTVKHSWLLNNEEKYNDKIRKAEEIFNITQLIDPKKEFQEVADMISTFDIAPIPVKIISHPDSPKGDYENELEHKLRFLKDGKFLLLSIDVTAQTKKNTLNLVEHYYDHFRNLLNKPETRIRDMGECYKIYDMKNDGKTSTEIIQTLWPTEYQKFLGKDDITQNKEYERLAQKYKADGIEDWDEMAYEEAYRGNQSMNKLYMRVKDNYDKAKRRINEVSISKI